MSNGRSPGKKRDTSRDSGGFVALPFAVLDCAAYLSLSVHAKALLLEVARQFNSKAPNNGRLLLSRAHLAPRGWNSNDMIMKAKRELLDTGFIFETAKGARPNKAGWYAVTWRALDKINGFDFGAERAFERSAYRKNATIQNASLRPPHGTGKAAIAPPHGTESPPPVPPHGAIRPISDPLPVPPDGHLLEVTISGARIEGVAVDPDPAVKVEKPSAHPEKPAARKAAAKPALKTCSECGQLFTAKRTRALADYALCCSSACKTRAWRKRVASANTAAQKPAPIERSEVQSC